ncbi:uncharacterized protein LOC109989110 isoform X3 [Xyrichtys novacula]|uniref:Uncharacterized protein LOC109989110 isoform X3 n=1 Tax=Xyrichtys novacula TaxID=13765 RepID=A0AAV1G9V4_XYRNO|nr:uncharacterized protein LOC109989110 isoform X3 [Xyrichtys novacula]
MLKHINEDCETLEQLLPIIHRSPVNMVTVMEKTVALLETVQRGVPAKDLDTQVQPRNRPNLTIKQATTP